MPLPRRETHLAGAEARLQATGQGPGSQQEGGCLGAEMLMTQLKTVLDPRWEGHICWDYLSVTPDMGSTLWLNSVGILIL